MLFSCVLNDIFFYTLLVDFLKLFLIYYVIKLVITRVLGEIDVAM